MYHFVAMLFSRCVSACFESNLEHGDEAKEQELHLPLLSFVIASHSLPRSLAATLHMDVLLNGHHVLVEEVR